MSGELEVLRRANPVLSDEAEAWTATTGGQLSHERLISAIESGATVLEPDTVIATRPRSSWRIVLAVALMVVVVVAVPLWLFGGSRDIVVSSGLPDGATTLDQTHPAMRLLTRGATDYKSFSEAALSQGLEDFACANGGGPPAPPSWELCLVADSGVLAVVPFNGAEGLTARVSDANLAHDVVVPIDTNQPVGVLDTGPQATVTVEYFGEWVGEMSAPWAPTQDGTSYVVPDELREATYQTGVNISGRFELPEAVFLEAAARACSEGGWDWEIARGIAADLLEPVPREQGAKGAAAVWLMAATACHDLIPQDALDLGPPPD